MSRSERRKPSELGSLSPASEESKEQGASGQRGGPRASQTPPEVPPQPAQASRRTPAGERGEPPLERKGFAGGEAPSDQGEKEHPSPEVIARAQKGIRRGKGQ